MGDLASLVPRGALVVLNDTRVLRARLLGKKPETGGKVEIFLVRKVGERTITIGGASDGEPETRDVEVWRALGKASKPLKFGTDILVGVPETPSGSPMLEATPSKPQLLVRLLGRAEDDGLLEVGLTVRGRDVPVEEAIRELGHIPLPPYIKRDDRSEDADRYQTVFARVDGAVAAPTAGLHVTRALLGRLAVHECEVTTITLHVGLGTFQPVTAEDLDQHPMHSERFEVTRTAAGAIARARERGVPVVAVGTTVVRALESAADPDRLGFVRPMAGDTRLLVQPGYQLRVVDILLTNFHLPRSTLLALVCAFGGTERVLAAYRSAVSEAYRFYSYGDAMLLDRARARREAAPTARAAMSRAEVRLPCRANDGMGAHRDADDRARRGRDPHVHAGGDAGEREDALAGRGRRDGGADRPRQHVPPVAPAGPRGHRRDGGAPRLHALAARDADRLGWLPGVLARSGAAKKGRRGEAQKSLVAPSEEGFTFRSHLDGSKHHLSPEEAVRVQGAIGADIQMQLDVCPPGDSPRAVVEAAVAQTTRWAKRALVAPRPREQALFGIVQGACFGDLRRAHADELAALDVNGGFDGLALGGFSVGEPIPRMYEALAEAGPALDPSRPRYLMGVGTPRDLLVAIDHGIDMFDCVLPTRNARNGQALTRTGKLVVKQARYRLDLLPIDPECACPTCRGGFSRSYLRHLYMAGEILALRLISNHNLHLSGELTRGARGHRARGSRVGRVQDGGRIASVTSPG